MERFRQDAEYFVVHFLDRRQPHPAVEVITRPHLDGLEPALSRSVQPERDVHSGVVGTRDLGELPPWRVEGHITFAHLDLDARRFGCPGQERIRNGPQRGVAGVLGVDQFIGVTQHEFGVAEHLPRHGVLRVARDPVFVPHPVPERGVVLQSGLTPPLRPPSGVVARLAQEQGLVAVHHRLPGPRGVLQIGRLAHAQSLMPPAVTRSQKEFWGPRNFSGTRSDVRGVWTASAPLEWPDPTWPLLTLLYMFSEGSMSLFTVFATSKIAASALAAGTLAVGGTGAAAFAGALPSDVQQSAHELLGAPAPHVGGVSETATADANAEASASATPSASADAAAETDNAKAGASATAVGPDATGPAAYGLCTAFTKGGLATSSTGFASLAIAAEGEANIDSYCADVVAAAKSDSHKVDGAGSGDAAADVNTPKVPEVPEAPELPTQAAVPAAPELPSEVPAQLPEVPTSAGRP